MYGEHWEWRAFGKLSEDFLKDYEKLPVLFGKETVIDEYLHVPGLNVNIKLRTGAEGGLKFKRFLQKDPPFEKWLEDEKEIYQFPLNREAWNKLSRELANVDICLPGFPQGPVQRDNLLSIMDTIGCRLIVIKKSRESRIFKALHAEVKIEFVEITAPAVTQSIGLENISTEDGDVKDREDLLHTIEYFQFHNEALQVMSYLKALEKWFRE